jgi:hypothetical protein
MYTLKPKCTESNASKLKSHSKILLQNQIQMKKTSIDKAAEKRKLLAFEPL